MKKVIKKIVLTLVILGLLIGGIIAYAAINLSPVAKEGTLISFRIEKGESNKTIFAKLEENEVIKNGDLAYFYNRLLKKADFKAGSFKLNSSWTLSEIIAYLSDSSNAEKENTVRVTFIEGEWLKTYARKISEATNLTADELLEYWNDPAVLDELMSRYRFLSSEIRNPDIRYPLEGYFFPDTYEFYKDTDCKTVTEKMLDRTEDIYLRYLNDIEASEFSFHEILTLASLIQYEAQSYDDMLLVASVFINRLHESESTKLQSSSTVCYAIDFDPETTSWMECESAANRDNPSPYNTYVYPGLTPGPIVGAGEDAIKAVLYHPDTDYFFFLADVCDGDGTIYYAKDYETHLANKERYITCY